ncbi:T9SS type A sorting domain-containing protein [Dysgonomonas reticulitermitis]
MLSGRGTQVEVSKLNPGVYIIKIDENNQIKFVKK